MLDHYIKHEQCVPGYVRLSAASRADMTAKVENLDEHGRCHSLPQYAIIGQQPEFSGAFHMSTTVHLTDDELADLKELTKQTDPAAAVRAAMHDYVRYARRMQLKQLSGRIQIQNNWQDLEASEMESQADTNGPGAD